MVVNDTFGMGKLASDTDGMLKPSAKVDATVDTANPTDSAPGGFCIWQVFKFSNFKT